MIEVDVDYIKEAIASGKTILIDFFAPWCGPCMRFTPMLEEMSVNFKNIEFVKINTDKEVEFAVENGVFSLPSVVIYNGGKEVARIAGSQPKAKVEEILKTI